MCVPTQPTVFLYYCLLLIDVCVQYVHVTSRYCCNMRLQFIALHIRTITTGKYYPKTVIEAHRASLDKKSPNCFAFDAGLLHFLTPLSDVKMRSCSLLEHMCTKTGSQSTPHTLQPTGTIAREEWVRTSRRHTSHQPQSHQHTRLGLRRKGTRAADIVIFR